MPPCPSCRLRRGSLFSLSCSPQFCLQSGKGRAARSEAQITRTGHGTWYNHACKEDIDENEKNNACGAHGKYLVISMALALLSAFTPHINKGKIAQISLQQALEEMRVSESELKELNKNCFGYLDRTLYFPPSEIEAEEKAPEIYRQTFEETTEILYRVFIATKAEQAASPRENYYNSFQKFIMCMAAQKEILYLRIIIMAT